MEKADILEMTVQFLKGANTRKRMQEGKAHKLTSVPSFLRWSVVRGKFRLFLFLAFISVAKRNLGVPCFRF